MPTTKQGLIRRGCLPHGTVAEWLRSLPHSKKVLGSIPGTTCVEFACSPRDRVGFLRALRFPPTIKTCMG